MRSPSSITAALVSGVAVLMLGLTAPPVAAQVDADAVQALLKKNDCLKCHAVDKKKEGPSFKETAARLKGKAGAEDEVYKHITTSPMVKVDGKEEEHKPLKSKDEAEARNVVRWILSR